MTVGAIDPDETLRLLRLTAQQMRADTDPAVWRAHAMEVVEYFDVLDRWLVKGGFPPSAWLTGVLAKRPGGGP